MLAVDLGTHGARVICVDITGKVHGKGSSSYQRICGSDGTQEQSLSAVWSGLKHALRQALASIPGTYQIQGMGVTHQRGTLVCWDQAGNPIGHAICDSDIRSWPQAKHLKNQVGADRLFQETGCPPLPFVGLSKILWIKDKAPEIYSQVSKWGSIQDWAVYQLTDDYVSSPGSALRLGLLSIQDPTVYAEELLKDIGLTTEQLIALRPLGSVLGRLSPRAASELALSEGIPIIAVPGDQPAGVLGAGAGRIGSAALNLGTSFLTSFPVANLADLVPGGSDVSYTMEILPENSFALELGSGAGTNVLDWMRDVLFEVDSEQAFNELMEENPSSTTDIIVLPFWWSALGSRQGSISRINSSHTRGDLVRAAYKGLAFEVRWAWDKLILRTGILPEQVGLFGGASRNSYLAQLLADVLVKPVYQVDAEEASAYGAAICTAVGIGWYENSLEAAGKMVKISQTYHPSQECQTMYQEYINQRDHIS